MGRRLLRERRLAGLGIIGLVAVAVLLLVSSNTGAQRYAYPVRSDTWTIAASNAPYQEKQQADWVADGTNDQVEIQAAIDALPATGGGVSLTTGVFNISGTIHLNKPIELSGQVGTRLVKTTDVVVLAVESPSVSIGDLEVDGSTTADTTNGIVIGVGYHASWTRLKNLYIHDLGGSGVLIDSSTSSAYFGLYQALRLYRNGTGLKLTGSANANTFQQLDLFGNTDWGINVDSGGSNTFSGLYFQGSNQKAMLLHQGNYNVITGLGAEYSSPALQIDAGAHLTTVTFSYPATNVVDNSDSSILINPKLNGQARTGIWFGGNYYYDRGSLKTKYLNIDTWGQIKGDGINYHPWSIFASEGTTQSPSWVEVFRFLYGGAMSWNQALGLKWAKVTADKTLSYESPDMVNYVDASSGPKVQTLPSAALARGRVYITKKIDSGANTVTIQPQTGELIEGQINKILTIFGQLVWYQSDGTAWWVLSE